MGHEKVALLDGGLPGWKRSKRTLDATVPAITPAVFTARPRHELMIDVAPIVAALGTPALQLLDARAEDRFAGENETLDPVGGHIPGAINRFYFDNLDDSGCYFKPADELREEFSGILGTRDPASVIQQCGSGVTACHNLLAMEIAGLSGSRLYPGSWSEWCADPSRPVATGPT
jgi:thiosulfate/3-mercaptopyruvate sulfurtransferase